MRATLTMHILAGFSLAMARFSLLLDVPRAAKKKGCTQRNPLPSIETDVGTQLGAGVMPSSTTFNLCCDDGVWSFD